MYAAPTPAAAAVSYLSVDFVDAQNGWVAGLTSGPRPSVVYRTRDGGASWKKVVSGPGAGGGGFAEVAFATPSLGIYSWGQVLHTADGGRTWTSVDSNNAHFADAEFASSRIGWAVAWYGTARSGGAISRTADGGSHWQEQKRLVGDSGFGDFVAVSCPTPSACFALKRGRRDGVWLTGNGGRSWTRRVLPANPAVAEPHQEYDAYLDVCFPSRTTGWAVGAGGTILTTTDAGRSWTFQQTPTDHDLVAVEFCDALHGLAVGDDGTIVRTVDGGSHWTTVRSGTTGTLADVCVIDTKRAWAVGWDGVRLQTQDGGKTWKGSSGVR
jgi:photosystem II stability/assembly factor-like uncharacterized protein